MKICLVGEFSKKYWTGSATHKVQKYILRELSKKNETILYELPPSTSKYKKIFSAIEFNYTEYGTIINGGLINFYFFIIKEKYEIIHFIVTRRFMLYLAAMLIFTPSKKVTTFHDTIALQNKKINVELILKRVLLALSSMVFVYNEYDKNIVSKFVDRKKIVKIKNGVDLSIYFPVDIKEKSQIITFAGGLGNPYKGLSFLESALKDVKQKFRFVICGENQKKLNHINFIGELDEENYISQLQRSYIVIIPSEYDSFSLTGLEAMACGSPIIITSTTGLSEYLNDGRGCFIIEYGDEKSLVKKIERLLVDENNYNQMKQDAVTAAQNFTWEKVSQEYLSNYFALIKND
jgi:glycosyltransferase involved in cell wall biosynthesis